MRRQDVRIEADIADLQAGTPDRTCSRLYIVSGCVSEQSAHRARRRAAYDDPRVSRWTPG